MSSARSALRWSTPRDWPRVQEAADLCLTNGVPCWRWLGSHRPEDGRPMIGEKYVYRELYVSFTGTASPPGVAHHECERPWCINPMHLEFITQSDHARQHGYLAARQLAKTHCPQDHEYTPENTRIARRGNGMTFRQCRTCKNEYHRELRRRRREARG